MNLSHDDSLIYLPVSNYLHTNQLFLQNLEKIELHLVYKEFIST